MLRNDSPSNDNTDLRPTIFGFPIKTQEERWQEQMMLADAIADLATWVGRKLLASVKAMWDEPAVKVLAVLMPIAYIVTWTCMYIEYPKARDETQAIFRMIERFGAQIGVVRAFAYVVIVATISVLALLVFILREVVFAGGLADNERGERQ